MDEDDLQRGPLAVSDARDMILDVGANEGEFALALAINNPAIRVEAFEPNPVLSASIMSRIVNSGCHNLACQQIAIDETSRVAVFHIADHHDRGVSSLMEFDKASIEANVYWSGREDLFFSYDLRVQVRRLDEVLASAPPGRIRFIKIDAQGVDLAVLRSLGALLGRVEAGMLEVSATLLTRLYTEEDIDLRAALNFLHEHGFDIHAIKPNDPAINEFNVMFHRRGLDWRAMEQELGLRGMPLYDGRHFWHMPADHLMTPEADLVTARLERDQATARATVDMQALATAREDAATLHAELVQLRESLSGAIHAVEHGNTLLAAAMHAADAQRMESAEQRLESAALRERREVLLLEGAALRAQIVELRNQLAGREAAEAAAVQRGAAMQDALARAMEAASGAYRVALASEQEASRTRATRTHLLLINEAVQAEMGEIRILLARRDAEADAARLETDSARLEAEMARLEVDSARQEAETARAATLLLRAEAELLTERIGGLYRSSSWRVTGPMRRMVRLLRG